MEAIFVALITAAGGVFAAIVQTKKLEEQKIEIKESKEKISHIESELGKKNEFYEEELEKQRELVERSFREPAPLADGEARNSIVVIGIGNSGKTQFIKGLINSEDADPLSKTQNYSIYHQKIEPSSKIYGSGDSARNVYERKIVNLYVSDYRGQNIGNLVSSFLFQQKVPNSPMLYGYINSLIRYLSYVYISKSNIRNQYCIPKLADFRCRFAVRLYPSVVVIEA